MEGVNTSGSCGENATWVLDGNVLHISGVGATTDYTNPLSSDASYPEWEAYKNNVKTVIIDEGITSIGSFSFYKCENIESVSLPEGLTRIGNYAFYGCHSLQAIEFPSSLEYIGDKMMNYCSNGYVFYGCNKLTSITLPEGLKVISGESFNYCDNLEQINWNAIDCDADVIDPVLRYVGIFVGSSVKMVIFGNNVKSIPAKTFYNIGGLYEISTPGTISFVGYEAFKGTQWQSNHIEPKKILYIDLVAYSFDLNFENESLYQNYSMEIAPGTKCVTDRLFEGSRYLVEVTLPESIEHIGNLTFNDCTALKTVNWNPSAILDDNRDYSAYNIFSKHLNINIESINFSNSVVSLPNGLLIDCNLLPEIKLPESLCSIGEDVFHRCNSIVSLTIPDRVKYIGRLAIYDCENLTKVTIGEGLEDFVYEYFLGACPKLTTLEWNAIKTTEKTFDPYHPFDICAAPIESFILGDKVEYVPGQLFWKSSTLNNIRFGNSVKVIGEAAFRECSALTSINLPESLEEISAYAFNYTPIECAIIPENVTKIGTWGFSDTPNLSKIIFTPVNPPINEGITIYRNENLKIYVPDKESYVEAWPELGELIEPILIADTDTLSDELPLPTFKVNIPDYRIISIDDEFIPETNEGEHVAYLRVSCEGPQGNFSATCAYHYIYKISSSIEKIDIDDYDYVRVFTLDGKKVYEGNMNKAKISLHSGIYLFYTLSGVKKIKIE